MNMLWVALGGALGAWSRYELGASITKRAGSRFPWGRCLSIGAAASCWASWQGCETCCPLRCTSSPPSDGAAHLRHFRLSASKH